MIDFLLFKNKFSVFVCLFVFNFFVQFQSSAADLQNSYIDQSVVTSSFKQLKNFSESYQLFSHGRSGELLLNGKWCNAQEIAAFMQPKINKNIQHLNIYGCEFAKGQKGLEAVAYLEKTLGISVSASTNITGKDGDWVLEVGKAKDVIALNNYYGNLACANGTLNSNQYATASSGGYSGFGNTTPNGAVGAPDNSYHSIWGTTPSNDGILTYANPFLSGDTLKITGKWYSTGFTDSITVAFSSDGVTWSSFPTNINGFNASTYTTVNVPLPASGVGAKYIRVSGKTANAFTYLDAIQVGQIRCMGYPISGVAYNDNGAGGGTANNCIKDGTETGTLFSSGMYAKLKTVAGANDISVTALAADGTINITDVANGTYVIFLDNNNNFADVTSTLPFSWSGTSSQTITVTNGVASPAINFCLTPSCPNGVLNTNQYATASTGGNTSWGGGVNGANGAPNNTFITVAYTTSASDVVLTYANSFVNGDTIKITGEWQGGNTDSITMAFSTDGITWSAFTPNINGFNAASFTTVYFPLPVSGIGAKYIKVAGKSNSTVTNIDAVQVGQMRCIGYPINGVAFNDNGVGGGTANNCVKDGTESGALFPSGTYAKLKKVAGANDISATALAADGTINIPDVANGTYVIFLDNNNDLTDTSSTLPFSWSGTSAKTITVTNGVASPAINFCLTTTCLNGALISNQYAIASSGGNNSWGGVASGAVGAPNGTYSTVYDITSATDVFLTYANAFLGGDTVKITAKLQYTDSIKMAFSPDGVTWFEFTPYINGFNATSFTTVSVPLPASGVGAKYIRVAGKSNSTATHIDAIQVGQTRCMNYPVSGVAYNDNGAGGGTANNCIKDGTESGSTLPTGLYAKIKTAGATRIISAAPMAANGTFTISDVANGTYTVFLDNNNSIFDYTATTPDYRGTNSQTVTVNNGVATPAISFCLHFLDSDGDGIGDDTDLDDDNDGILDVNEGCALNIVRMDTLTWTGNGTITENITANQIDMKGGGSVSWVSNYTNQSFALPIDLTFSTTLAASTPSTGNNYYDNLGMLGLMPVGGAQAPANSATDGAYKIYLQGNNVYPQFPGGSGSYVTYNPNDSFRISISVYGVLTMYRNGVAIYTQSGLPTNVNYVLAQSANAGGKTNFSNIKMVDGNTTTVCKDTDGDGIPDYLDLDSDGDGCPDALEAGVNSLAGVTMLAAPAGKGIATATANAVVQGPYGANGYANSVETVAESGIYKGSSTYNLYALNPSLKLCAGLATADFDGDGIPDIIDLDDDNDGVLDVIENGCLTAAALSSFPWYTWGLGVNFSNSSVATGTFPTTFANGTPLNGTASNALYNTASFSLSCDGDNVYRTDVTPAVAITNGNLFSYNHSSAQPAVFVPDPANPNGVYVFTTGPAELAHYSYINYNPSTNTVSVDPNKKYLSIEGNSSMITTIKKPNGIDSWVVTAIDGTPDKIVVYDVTANGVNLVNTVPLTAPANVLNTGGTIVFSPDGSKIGWTSWTNNGTNWANFNTATGAISNIAYNSLPISSWGLAFSPDNTKLYASGGNSNGTQAVSVMDVSTTGSINYLRDIASAGGLLGMQYGPDGRLYISNYKTAQLMAIDNPNGATDAAMGIHLIPATGAGGGLPQVAQGICTGSLDTDGDGIPNRLDLDSDGDGCGDAYESGTTTNPTVFVINGPYSGNGFADALQASADTNTYKSTYTYINAITSGTNNCPKNKTNPDINITYVNVATTGNVVTNDTLTTGTSFGTPQPQASNPAGATITMNANGTYNFTATTAGVYSYLVPACPTGVVVPNCPLELLTITVLDASITTNKPVANTDYATTTQNHAITINTLGNDQSGNAAPVILKPATITVSSQPKHGTVTVDTATGNTTYTPATGYAGIDTLTYSVCNSNIPAQCATALQIITIKPYKPGNNYTNASDDYSFGLYNAPISGDAKANDTDPEGNSQTITAQTTTVTGKGTLVLGTDGKYTFTPVSGFTGPVSFPYKTCDNGTPQACAQATINLLVAPQNINLPIKIVAMNAVAQSCEVVLNWETGTAKDVAYFELEKSLDGAQFNFIGKVKAINTSVNQTYQYNDEVKVNGKWFYRLKIVEDNGSYFYANNMIVDTKCDKAIAVELAPNPADNYTQLTINSEMKGQKIEVKVVDMMGKEVYLENVLINQNLQIINIDTHDLASGIYTVMININDVRFIRRLMKK